MEIHGRDGYRRWEEEEEAAAEAYSSRAPQPMGGPGCGSWMTALDETSNGECGDLSGTCLIVMVMSTTHGKAPAERSAGASMEAAAEVEEDWIHLSSRNVHVNPETY